MGAVTKIRVYQTRAGYYDMDYKQFITEIQKYWDLRDKGLKKQANHFLFAFTRRFKEEVSEQESDDILFQLVKG